MTGRRPQKQRSILSIVIARAANFRTTYTYEYAPFSNEPDDVNYPRDRRVAELALLSVVDAKAAI